MMLMRTALLLMSAFFFIPLEGFSCKVKPAEQIGEQRHFLISVELKQGEIVHAETVHVSCSTPSARDLTFDILTPSTLWYLAAFKRHKRVYATSFQIQIVFTDVPKAGCMQEWCFYCSALVTNKNGVTHPCLARAYYVASTQIMQPQESMTNVSHDHARKQKEQEEIKRPVFIEKEQTKSSLFKIKGVRFISLCISIIMLFIACFVGFLLYADPIWRRILVRILCLMSSMWVFASFHLLLPSLIQAVFLVLILLSFSWSFLSLSSSQRIGFLVARIVGCLAAASILPLLVHWYVLNNQALLEYLLSLC